MEPLAALLISALSLVVACLALGWQIASYLLDGRRVRVALLHGVLDPARGMAATGLVGRDGEPKRTGYLRGQGIDGEQVLGIAATNVGRAPLRIDAFRLHLLGNPTVFRPGTDDTHGPPIPYRLPAGESETWFVPLRAAEALIAGINAVPEPHKGRVRLSVELGTGDTKDTRHSLRVAPARRARPLR